MSGEIWILSLNIYVKPPGNHTLWLHTVWLTSGFNLYCTASTTELRLAFSEGLLYPSGPKGLDFFLSEKLCY